MTRRRLYNPAQLTPEELKASFVARQETLAEMLRIIGEQQPGHPCQHMMLIGPRGMGKTTLGLRLLHEILVTPSFATIWQPVPFHEESYGISNLAEFWLTTLHHLTRATGETRWTDRADALARDERDDNRLAAYALAALVDYCQANGKRLILFVENLDTIFKQLGDERQIHQLRATLIERSEILLIGSANTVFDAIHSHGEPLYEFFRLFVLKGLRPEETQRLLATLADDEGRSEVVGALNHEQGRLETLRRMTDGNPRLLVLACRILIESPVGSAFEDLERLIDEQTPYFKARIEELPTQARKVFHCLAEGWRPMLAKEVADAAKLNSSHSSAQLRQLMEKGYAREVTVPYTKRTLYEVSDRFYNIYYLLRSSRASRDRLTRLISFLHDLFGPIGMRTMYPATLAALRSQKSRVGDTSNLLAIMAGYVANDEEFTGRENWLRQALDLAKDMIGPNAPVIGEIRHAFTDRQETQLARLSDLMNRCVALLMDKRFEDAKSVCWTAIGERPNDTCAWTFLGLALAGGEDFEDAISAFDQVLDHTHAHDTSGQYVMIDAALAGKVISLFQLERYAAVVALVERFGERLRSGEPGDFHQMTPLAFYLNGRALKELERDEEAMVAWDQVAEYISVDSPQDLRHTAAKALAAKGAILVSLDRHEDAVAVWTRVAEYVQVNDPPELRRTVAEALRAASAVLNKLEEPEESMRACEQAARYVFPDDPPALRQIAATALSSKYATLLILERYDESSGVWRAASDYVRPDDPRDLLEPIVALLAAGANLLSALGRWVEAEEACKRLTHIDPTHHESWRVLANAILYQNDSSRLPKAEDFARQAVKLAPDSADALHTLGEVLAGRENWTGALEAFEHALRIGRVEFQDKKRPSLTVSLCQALAAGYAPQLKRIIEDFSLVDSMEPLWHAVRLELGEHLEPLPAEITDAVTDIRRVFINNPDVPSGDT